MKKLIATTALATVIAAPALAAVTASTATDLNLRSGPGTEFKSIAVMPGGEDVMVNGCVDTAEWCSVTFGGQMGWAYGPYLAVDNNGEYAAISTRPTAVEVETVTYQPEGDTDEMVAGAAAGATMGAIAATAIGGPIGGVIAGGILGAAAGTEAAQPDEETIAYVTANPVDTTVVRGEAIVGAKVPLDQVAVYEIPNNADFAYVYLNGEPVIVRPDSGEIVYIVR